MKKIVNSERYEEHGSPLCGMNLFIGTMWLMLLILHITDGDSGISVACSALLMAASFLSAWTWHGYRLVADEKGIELKQGRKVRVIPWQEIERVTIHNKVSFWKATGLTFHFADPARKPLYINKEELLPLVKRYAACPIEEGKRPNG